MLAPRLAEIMPTAFETLIVARGARLRRKENNMVSAQDIVRAAYALQGVKYREWRAGSSIPMWRDDGVLRIPLNHHLHNVGVRGSDLINFALESNNLPPGGGTGSFGNYLVNTSPFDPSTPGQPGAIAFRPYSTPYDDGSIALYVGEHQLIQSIPLEGVTDKYTDQVTYSWASHDAPRYSFTVYGFLPGVQYS